jgi:hypothetical protein
MKIIIIAVFGLAIVLALLCGVIYPSAKSWSYLAAGSFGVHLALAIIVSLRNLLDAAKISAWSWQGISAILTVGLLIPYGLRQGDWWLLVAAALVGFTMLVTLIVVLVFARGGVADMEPKSTSPRG